MGASCCARADGTRSSGIPPTVARAPCPGIRRSWSLCPGGSARILGFRSPHSRRTHAQSPQQVQQRVSADPTGSRKAERYGSGVRWMIAHGGRLDRARQGLGSASRGVPLPGCRVGARSASLGSRASGSLSPWTRKLVGIAAAKKGQAADDAAVREAHLDHLARRH